VLRDRWSGRSSALDAARTSYRPAGEQSLHNIAVAPRAGADLRAARERLAWPLAEVASQLRIRQSYLEALERGELSLLPGNAYVLGFLRSYASALGLEPEETVRRFRAEAAAVDRKPELAFPVPASERSVPAGAAIFFGLVLLVAVYAGSYRLSADGRLPAEAITPVPQRLAPLAQQAIPPTTADGHAPTKPNSPPLAHMDAPIRQDAVPAAPTVSSSSAAAAPLVPPAPTPPAFPQPGQREVPRIVIRASADSWLQVRERNGAILLNRVLKAGETWPVPDKSNLVLATGNAGGTELVVDGVVAPSLGAAGAVRRDLALDPDVIRDGKSASPQPAAALRPHP
jgi:cytoskeleton protein RodZ